MGMTPGHSTCGCPYMCMSSVGLCLSRLGYGWFAVFGCLLGVSVGGILRLVVGSVCVGGAWGANVVGLLRELCSTSHARACRKTCRA